MYGILLSYYWAKCCHLYHNISPYNLALFWNLLMLLSNMYVAIHLHYFSGFLVYFRKNLLLHCSYLCIALAQTFQISCFSSVGSYFYMLIELFLARIFWWFIMSPIYKCSSGVLMRTNFC